MDAADAWTCASCREPIPPLETHCRRCGRPTMYASHEEQAAYEVGLWRAARERDADNMTFRPRPA